jgi:hypothetical protein
MISNTGMIVLGDTSPGVLMVAETSMDVDAAITRFQSGVVAMTGETSMSATPDWSPQVFMSGESSFEGDPS